MPNSVIFARPRWDYDSYQDLYRLIELSGYPLIFADEIDVDSGSTYVVTMLNGETMNGWRKGISRVILYDLEWHLEGFSVPGVSEVWTGDAWYARQIGARYVPVGSHPALALSAPHTQAISYDAALMAYMGPPRRQQVAFAMQAMGLRLAPNAWREERDLVLRRSRCVVSVHQHDNIPAIAAQRVALAAAYGLPVICETLADRGIFNANVLPTSDHANFADFAYDWLCRNDARILDDYGAALHYHLCVENTFEKAVNAAL